MEMLLIIAWVILCLVAAGIASEKGHSGFQAFVMSLFLSPAVGLIYFIGIPVNHDMLISAKVKEGKLKRCPYCDEAIRKSASVCSYCQSQQAEAVKTDANDA